MSADTHPHDALQSYVDKWLAVQPQQRVALVFVDAAHYPGHIALAALEQEILSAAYGIREPHVALSKLNWWAEELGEAASTGGRHPLTRVLFDEERAHAIPKAQWLAPIIAAMAQLEQGTATDFAAQLEAASPLHTAFATLETTWWYGEKASPARAARTAALNHLLYALCRLRSDIERDRLALPMSRLATFGLSRHTLREPSDALAQAVKAQLVDLRDAWRIATGLSGPLSVFRALESRQDHRLTLRAARAADPLESLRRGESDRGFGLTLAAWQAARHWRRQAAEPRF